MGRYSLGNLKRFFSKEERYKLKIIADERQQLILSLTDIIENETICRQGEGIYLVTGYNDSKAFAEAIVKEFDKHAD